MALCGKYVTNMGGQSDESISINVPENGQIPQRVVFSDISKPGLRALNHQSIHLISVGGPKLVYEYKWKRPPPQVCIY